MGTYKTGVAVPSSKTIFTSRTSLSAYTRRPIISGPVTTGDSGDVFFVSYFICAVLTFFIFFLLILLNEGGCEGGLSWYRSSTRGRLFMFLLRTI